MPLDELKQLIPKLVKEKDLNFTVKNHDEVASTPPTHLKNGKLFKSFETIVEMYGVPNYTELDPTIFVAITAFLMFGFMFGDVGQGLVIALIGLILKKKKSSMGPIFMAGGISSIIFGFLYGSIFGNEDILKPILISPMENINTMLISGIVFGTILILIAMILNIRNGIKNNDKTKIFFSENGVAGFVFYCTILITVVYFYLKGKLIVSKVILGIIFAVALICILFKDSITNKIERKKPKEKASMVERIFELIEVLLSFASNTISFVRLAAFAINHVGLCMAVYILSGLTTGAGNIAITILGNILVIVLEGLIVAIQVLRLEYYELFSRFYSGDGKPYKPISSELK
jgi:V/A-type H+-transporting ATPase subunit I